MGRERLPNICAKKSKHQHCLSRTFLSYANIGEIGAPDHERSAYSKVDVRWQHVGKHQNDPPSSVSRPLRGGMRPGGHASRTIFQKHYKYFNPRQKGGSTKKAEETTQQACLTTETAGWVDMLHYDRQVRQVRSVAPCAYMLGPPDFPQELLSLSPGVCSRRGKRP
ncbi:unnamed protein product [Ectocarpus sp. 4 AP-2014]